MAKKNSRAVSIGVPDRMYASVSVRKIENGFIISESTEGPKGYKSCERFSPTKPKIQLPIASAPAKAAAKPKPNALARAAKSLKR